MNSSVPDSASHPAAAQALIAALAQASMGAASADQSHDALGPEAVSAPPAQIPSIGPTSGSAPSNPGGVAIELAPPAASRQLRLALNTSDEQRQRLVNLQAAFAKVCNALGPLVQQTRVWNRVALHHMAYKGLREQFPDMGSQMVCNAIYSVSRSARLVFQHPKSPFHLSRLPAGRALPLLRFGDDCPVYFDRHTLSVKAGTLSMYTLDGRMRFQLALAAEDEAAFHSHKLREIVLARRADSVFELSFALVNEALAAADEAGDAATPPTAEIPEYLIVDVLDAPSPAISATPPPVSPTVATPAAPAP